MGRKNLPHGCEVSGEATERVQNIYPLVDDGTVPELARPEAEQIPCVHWHMRGFHEQCLERYKELRLKAGGGATKLKEYLFPSIDDHQIPPEEYEQEGIRSKDVAKIVPRRVSGG